jgi:hypothetical protein
MGISWKIIGYPIRCRQTWLEKSQSKLRIRAGKIIELNVGFSIAMLDYQGT